MVDFFKRSDAAKAATPTLGDPASNTKERRRFPRPLPVPEVVEGNDNSDWALWEESVSVQDSLMQPLTQPSALMEKQDGTTGQGAGAADAFASVHKRSS